MVMMYVVQVVEMVAAVSGGLGSHSRAHTLLLCPVERAKEALFPSLDLSLCRTFHRTRRKRKKLRWAVWSRLCLPGKQSKRKFPVLPQSFDATCYSITSNSVLVKNGALPVKPRGGTIFNTQIHIENSPAS